MFSDDSSISNPLTSPLTLEFLSVLKKNPPPPSSPSPLQTLPLHSCLLTLRHNTLSYLHSTSWQLPPSSSPKASKIHYNPSPSGSTPYDSSPAFTNNPHPELYLNFKDAHPSYYGGKALEEVKGVEREVTLEERAREEGYGWANEREEGRRFPGPLGEKIEEEDEPEQTSATSS
ncbi:hypothetical protein TrST_g5383 [Triparma strigata]|uniref:Uncharacterized protein n=1 Tax=Triparma strigata TaxID=1606541 RepID=A0A9W7BUW6_9STRA|nr:hypothetical protein TrST_g5383 [Triparma strigata]